MGETPKITDPLEALAAARASFEAGDDFTVGVEEEFAILDARDARHDGRLRADRRGDEAGPLAGMVAGELIRSEVEVRTGRCETFPRRPRRWRGAGSISSTWPTGLGYRLSAAGTHPFARWQDQEVIDTPHYHLVESTLRYVAWRNNTFGIHVHTGIRGADRAIAVSSALRVGAARAAGGCRAARRGWRAATRTSSRRAPRSSPGSSRAAASPTDSSTGTSTTASCAS